MPSSVLDEFYRIDRDDPNSSNCRIIHNRGERVDDDGKFTLSPFLSAKIMDLATFLPFEKSTSTFST